MSELEQALLAALQATLDAYLHLAGRTDYTYWDPETEDHVKAARAAIAKAQEPR